MIEEIEEYRFERLSESNIEDLKILYKDAFNENRSTEYTNSKFNTQELGGKFFAFIAYDRQNFPSAFYALFPFQLVLEGKKHFGGQIADLMTHSSHRRKGLYYKLANHTHNFAKENGMEFIIGVSYGMNNGTYEGLKKLNFTDPENFGGYHLKIKTLPVNRYSQKSSILNKIYRPYFNFIKKLFFKKVDYFKYTQKETQYGEIIKDEKYINYKYGYSTCMILEIGKVRFLCKIKPDGSLAIGDIDKNNELDIHKAIKKLKRIAFWLGIRIIQFEVSKGHLIDKVLSSKYSSVDKYRVLYYNLNENFPGDKIKYTLADIDTF